LRNQKNKSVPFSVLSDSPEETFRIGRILADGLVAGDVVALTGELGSGKTCLTQGIASGLGVPESYAVTSPTFTLINEYPGRDLVLYHLDLYRLTGCADLPDIGYDEYLAGGGVVVIEWAEKVLEAVPANALFVVMKYVEENVRRIEITGCRDRIGLLEERLTEGGC
jgi:tRNA threonylcarbamoyladenosine biosynthesis protein TsaE